jgi:hypothetical protein
MALESGATPEPKEVVRRFLDHGWVPGGRIVEHWGGLGAGGQLHRALTADA